MSGIVAYREGDFSEPAWRGADANPIIGEACVPEFEEEISLQPGISVQPESWRLTLANQFVLADSLESGLYRFGAESVVVGLDSGETVGLIAPNSIRLESSE